MLLILLPAATKGAVAQVDYRNLDDDRPTVIEDAIPLERWAFEFIAPWRFEQDHGGGTTHSLVPELATGVLPNLHLGFKLPIAGVESDGEWQAGLSGIRVFGFYNFSTESISLPALSIRVDATLPVGSLAGEGARVGVKGIATRSWGRHRVHLNASYGVGSDDAVPAAEEGVPRWSAGAAWDWTFVRESLLLVGEVYGAEVRSPEPTELNAGIGLRFQVGPTLVLDLGVSRRLLEHGPDVALTLGLTHAFAVRALMPAPKSVGRNGTG
jgi:hypothetical protein